VDELGGQAEETEEEGCHLGSNSWRAWRQEKVKNNLLRNIRLWGHKGEKVKGGVHAVDGGGKGCPSGSPFSTSSGECCS
jgi:hypothetical protein